MRFYILQCNSSCFTRNHQHLYQTDLSKQQGVEAPPTWIDDEGESDDDGENKQNLNDVHHKRLGELSNDVPADRRITECYVAKESHLQDKHHSNSQRLESTSKCTCIIFVIHSLIKSTKSKQECKGLDFIFSKFLNFFMKLQE